MKALTEPLGQCRFEDLPQVYQDWFADGAEKSKPSDPRLFVPENYPWVGAALFPLWLLLSSAPLIGILESSTTAPWRAIAIVIAAIPPLWVVGKAIGAISGVAAIRQANRHGRSLYGLAVDEHALVLRLFQPFAMRPRTCLYLPRSHILRYERRTEFDEGSGNNRSSYLRVLYRDHQGRPQAARLASRSTLELAPLPLEKALRAWDVELTGNWRRSTIGRAAAESDLILEFHEDGVGSYVDLADGDVLVQYPFHWRLEHRRQVVLEPATAEEGLPIRLPSWLEANPIESDAYAFEIRIESCAGEPIYVLRFRQKVAGMLLGDLGQAAQPT